MGRISLKALIRAVFYALGIIALSGCIMEPVNLTGFVEDDDVIEIIDRGAGTVRITDDTYDSEPKLKEGNKKITGLDEDKYYKIEEWGENPVNKEPPNNIMFVAANGARAASLAGIGRVTGKEITELTNKNWYRVRSAQALTGSVTYYDLAGLVDVEGSAAKQNDVAIIDGAITIKPPEKGGYIIFEPPLSSLAPIDNFDIVKVPYPDGPTTPVPLISDKILAEADGEMVVDYVFYDRKTEKLYVLKVIITNEEPPEPPEPGVFIYITLSTGDNSPVLSGPTANTNISYPQNSKASITISIINNPAQFNDITWYLDGTQIPSGTGASLIIDLNNEAVQYRLVGVYTITVTALKDGIPYSAAIQVTVLPSP